ncbi:MAG: hypothetical protein Rubg2KO_23540 [Rubricoccaceae bacterium]
MMRALLVVVGLVCLASSSHAQGTCAVGTAQAALETTEFKVALFNTGGLFFGGSTTSGDGYQIPKGLASSFGEGVSPVFATSFWVGGKVNGELRTAAARYGRYQFWPGPLDDTASPPDDCAAYDHIYTVSRQDVARYLATGRATDDLRDWPVEAGAPVVDGDGDPTNYNLAGGDQPEILGDVNAFWVMNDAGRLRDTTWTPQFGTLQVGTPPLGIEVRVLAYAFDPPLLNALSETTFYRYEVVNRSAQAIDSLYVSMWSDIDLGDAGDDYVGTDTLRNLIYVYNNSNEDSAYGEAPPAWGIQVLDGFVGLANGRDDDFDGTVDEADEEMRLSTAPIAPKWSCGSGTGDPSTPQGYFNVQRGLFDSGLPVHAFGSGCPAYGTAEAQAPQTLFSFSGDPVQGRFWSEVNADGQGNGNPQGDRRMVLSTGPGRLAPGESVELVYAMPYARGETNLKSVTAVRALAGGLSGAYDDGVFAFRPVERSEYQGDGVELPERQLEVSRVNPNPSAPGGAASAVLVLPDDARVRATVYDALGRQLDVLVDSELAEGETVLQMPDGLAPGTYVLRVEVAPGAVQVVPFTVVR